MIRVVASALLGVALGGLSWSLPLLAGTPDPQMAIQACLDCHDYGEDAPAHQVLLGSHGIDGDAEDIGDRRGCLDCHGESTAHVAKPREHAPDTSFGPRWSATAAAQDKPCLACHEENVAANWRHALHMVNGMTCITCHDIHQAEDRVLIADQQAGVCTTCHKAQKSGIHDLEGTNDPQCSLCHNPHNHESAAPQMQANQSAGCMVCHDDAQMETLAALNPRAGKYHRVVANGNRTCIDCHQGISHAPEESTPPLHATPVRGRSVTLFYPGNANRQWLLQDHPGSQPLRQGTNCQRCHRGEEAEMGAALAGDFEPAARVVGIAFAREEGQLHITLSWQGPADDAQVAMMWGGPDNVEFKRGGCFAACHGGDPNPATKVIYAHGAAADEATMGGLATPGEGAELWRISLADGELHTALVTDRMNRERTNPVTVKKSYREGQWKVELRLDLEQAGSGVEFSADGRYTFGIALHGEGNEGREHWVSLPMSMSFSGHSTDFIAE